MKEQDYFKDYLGYVFQNYALIEEETVYDNLKMLAPKSNIVEALHSVGLDSSFLSQCIYELSGGQAQRVAIARLLLKRLALFWQMSQRVPWIRKQVMRLLSCCLVW